MFISLTRRVCVLSVMLSALWTPAAILSSLMADDATRPAGIPQGAVPFDLKAIDAPKAWSHEKSLYISVPNAAGIESLNIPRLANVVETIHWLSTTSAPLTLQPEPKHWIIKCGKPKVDGDTVLVIKFDAPPLSFDESQIIEPGENGLVLLPAKLATTNGATLRFEPQPHKNTVGYWANPEDTAQWSFQVSKDATYEVDILQGCGSGHGGSSVDLKVGDETLAFTVQETGHFQNFVWRTIGSVKVHGGSPTILKLAPTKKPGGAVMDVRAVRLSPPRTKRDFESQLAEPSSLPKTKE